jgi:diguanylate cyclase (GGDEF)-like protein
MYEDEAGKNAGELDRLARERRRIYMAGMLLVAGVLVCAWIYGSPADAHRAISAPVYVLILMALVAALWGGLLPLARVEALMLVVLSAMPITRQVWLFYPGVSASEEWLRLLGNSYWATSGLLVIFYAIGDRRRALLAGSGVVAASALIAAVGVWIGLESGGMPSSVVVYVTGSLLFLTMFLVMLSGATIMRDQWQSALSRAEAYSRLAMKDMLTGLGNRREAFNMMSDLSANARTRHTTFSVILGDLDDFKQVNDSAGHAAGDAVLVEVAKRMRETVRDSDRVMRWGGEEFLIVAPQTHLTGARELAERCRSAIEVEPLSGSIRITMTFGVAEFQAGDSEETLLARADANLYAGKRESGNRVEAMAEPGAVQSLPAAPG